MVPSVVALGISIAMLVGYNAPDKPYEIIALAVVVPWIILTFANPPAGRMHWLPAGVIGGLIVLTYQGFFVFAALGVLMLMWGTWRSSGSRAAEVRRFAYIAVTALAVSSWYVLPYVYGLLTLPTEMTSDTYEIATYVGHPVPVPFLQPGPAGLLLLVGLAGLVWWRKTLWWAQTLGIMLIATYIFYVLAVVRFVLTTHNMFAHYSTRLVAEILAIAGVLTIAEVVRLLMRNFDPVKVRSSAIILTGAFAVLLSMGYWHGWKPTTVPLYHDPRVNLNVADLNPADAPLTEPLPSGKLPKFAAPKARAKWLPVWQIRDEVAARYGKDYKPTVLTTDERIFSYLPWYLYMQPSQAVSGTFVQAERRSAAITALQNETDPTRFAQMVNSMDLGPIDVFLLREDPDEKWTWRGSTRFDPKMFETPAFDVVHLQNNYVLVIRKP
jgi:hypothetical protein